MINLNKEITENIVNICGDGLNKKILDASRILANDLKPLQGHNPDVDSLLQECIEFQKEYNTGLKPSLEGYVKDARTVDEIADLFTTKLTVEEGPRLSTSFESGKVQNKFV